MFDSKAGTLRNLDGKLTKSQILPQMSFDYADWCNNKENIIQKVIDKNWTKLIVRSSCSREDSFNESAAGKFKSVGDIYGNKSEDIAAACLEVFISFGEDILPQDEVLIQPFLSNVDICGVGTTVDLDTLSQYYVINYDDSGSTNSITSGTSNSLTYVQYGKYDKLCDDSRLNAVILALREVEEVCHHKLLDIEFAVVGDQVYILQVRPIVITSRELLFSRVDLHFPLRKVFMKIENFSQIQPTILGEKAVFSVMTDWNPAEMIGLRPRQLALSLYQELITDSIWAEQRYNYGYRDLRGHPLLISFMGQPFIDARCSINSFIPASLDEAIAAKLVRYYLERLTEKPELHDKVEFEILFSCFTPVTYKKLKQLKTSGFSDDEIQMFAQSLKNLTLNILDMDSGPLAVDQKRIDTLLIKHEAIMTSNLSQIDKIYWILENTKKNGTLPFAGLARAAFIATEILNGLESEGIISIAEREEFLGSIESLPTKLSLDLLELPEAQFCEQYGHLRPGTYEVTIPNYRDGYQRYFSRKPERPVIKKYSPWSTCNRQKVNQWLAEHGFSLDVDKLQQFIRLAIEGRENAKFKFSKCVNDLLETLVDFCLGFALSREDVSYLDIAGVKALYGNLNHQNIIEYFAEIIKTNRVLHKYSTSIKLPGVIINPEDVYRFQISEDLPNFITRQSVIAPITSVPEEGTGKIVFIDSSDPGYDYIFGYGIAALVTKFGGANSHMAIRCAELGIPAIIGAGEKLYNYWLFLAKKLHIDCAAKKVELL